MKMKGLVPFVFLLLVVRVVSTSSSLHRSPITMDGLLDDDGDARLSRGKSKDEDSDPLSSYASTLLSTGTTICGLRCVDGVVLGADSRSTSEKIIADQNKQKIRQLAPSILIAGR